MSIGTVTGGETGGGGAAIVVPETRRCCDAASSLGVDSSGRGVVFEVGARDLETRARGAVGALGIPFVPALLKNATSAFVLISQVRQRREANIHQRDMSDSAHR